MIAILVHFLGHLVVDSAVPPWVGAADAYFLAWWFVAFAAVDLIAAALAKGFVRVVLAIGFGWSVALAVEQAMLVDILHQADQIMQVSIDGTLAVYFFFMLLGMKRQKGLKA